MALEAPPAADIEAAKAEARAVADAIKAEDRAKADAKRERTAADIRRSAEYRAANGAPPPPPQDIPDDVEAGLKLVPEPDAEEPGDVDARTRQQAGR